MSQVIGPARATAQRNRHAAPSGSSLCRSVGSMGHHTSASLNTRFLEGCTSTRMPPCTSFSTCDGHRGARRSLRALASVVSSSSGGDREVLAQSQSKMWLVIMLPVHVGGAPLGVHLPHDPDGAIAAQHGGCAGAGQATAAIRRLWVQLRGGTPGAQACLACDDHFAVQHLVLELTHWRV